MPNAVFCRHPVSSLARRRPSPALACRRRSTPLSLAAIAVRSHPPSGPIATSIILGPPPSPSFGKTTCGGSSIRSNPSVTSERLIARCNQDRAGAPWVGSGEAGEAGKTLGGGSRAARRQACPAAATMGVSGPGRRRAHDARHRDRGGRRRRRWATAAQWAAGQQGGRGR